MNRIPAVIHALLIIVLSMVPNGVWYSWTSRVEHATGECFRIALTTANTPSFTYYQKYIIQQVLMQMNAIANVSLNEYISSLDCVILDFGCGRHHCSVTVHPSAYVIWYAIVNMYLWTCPCIVTCVFVYIAHFHKKSRGENTTTTKMKRKQ